LLALRTPQLRQNTSFAVYCSASVQQKLANFFFAPTGRRIPGCQPCSEFEPTSINRSAFGRSRPAADATHGRAEQ
jgi:hypothetical protein